MRAVAIDAATRRAGVALWEDGAIVAVECSEDWTRHAERLTGLMAGCFAKAGWSRESIDACVGGVGPGSFTGARVGLATAKGLALALGRPLVGVVSLDAMAAAVVAQGALSESETETRILALLDAGREEVFASMYAASGERRLGPLLVPPREIEAVFLVEGAERTLVIGEAAQLPPVGAVLASLDIRILSTWATDLPDPGVVARLGMARLIAGAKAGVALDELASLEPFYVRAPDITKAKGV
jgi:tRNA threonylcarbamoyladenosine biosynthesis protein TsaB